MKKITFFLVIVFAAFIFISLGAQEKDSKIVEVSVTKVESFRGAGPHITPKPVIDEVVVPKPAENDKVRADNCEVIVDWTGYASDVYVDGEYFGTDAAWSDGSIWAISGKTKLYAQSVGETMYWLPTYVDCLYEHTWKLMIN